MDDKTFSPQDLGITEQDWQQTPPAVRAVVQSIGTLQAEITKLKEQMNLSSSTSSKPPSSDEPRHKHPKEGKKRGERHQTCWAHLLRHFKRLELRDEESAEVGAWLVRYSEYLLHRWRQVCDGHLARSDFDAEMPQHRHDIEHWLQRGAMNQPTTRRNGFCGMV